MKNRYFGVLSVLIIIVAGILWPMQSHAQRYRRTTVEIGTSATTNQCYAPFINSNRHGWVQMIYSASEIGIAGYIDTIWYHCARVANANNLDTAVKLYMGHTIMTEAQANNSWVPQSDLTLVLTARSVQPTDTGWFAIVLDSAFYYNGEDNLAIAVSRHGATNNTSQRYYYNAAPNGATLYRSTNASASYGEYPRNANGTTPTGTMSTHLPAIKLSVNEEYYSCPKATGLTALAGTDSSLVLDWDDGGEASSWLIVYGPEGFEPGSGDSLLATSHPDTRGSLMSNTAYDFYVTTICDTDDVGLESRKYTATTRCQIASALDTVEVRSSFARLSWQGLPGYYVIGWRLEAGGAWRTDTVDGTEARIGGLTGDTVYMVCVKGACETGDWGDTVVMRTRPGIDLFPVYANASNATMGTVTGSGLYASDDTVTIEATPNPHHRFLGWDDGSMENPRDIVITDTVRLTARFAVNNYRVIVSCTPEGTGSVSGTGVYAYNSRAQIMVIPSYGYHFVRWSDGNQQFTRTITVVSDSTLVAEIAPSEFTLTVHSADSSQGQVSGSGSYEYRTTALIEALPSVGHHFMHWDDGNTANPRTVDIRGNLQYTAFFAIDTYNVSIVSLDSTHGNTTGGGLRTYGQTVDIIAFPAEGYHFSMWSDSSTANPRTITVNSDTLIYAFFLPGTYTLSALVDSTGWGTVIGTGSYDYGDSTLLTAVAEQGYHFMLWGDSVTDNPRMVTTLGDSTFTAIFMPNTYYVRTLCDTAVGGSIQTVDSARYLDPVTLTVTPNFGYTFRCWNDGSAANPRTITLMSDTTLIALFTPNRYFVSVTSSADSLGVGVGTGYYNYDGTVTLSAAPMPHYHFTAWNDGDTTNPRTITVKGDTAFTASFAIDVHTVTILSDDTAMSRLYAVGRYDYGTTAVLRADALPGYHFTRWNDGNPNNPRTITVLSDSTFTASFALSSYSVTVLPDDLTHGTTSGSGMYEYMTTATIEAIPSRGYRFQQWNDGSTRNPRTIVATCDTTFTALFSPREYQIRVLSDNSSMGSAQGSGRYTYGTQATLTALPAAHNRFLRWSDGILDNPRTVTVLNDSTFTAQFEAEHNTLVVQSADSSMGAVSGTGSYSYGTQATLIARANPGYRFLRWNDGNTDNPRTVTVYRDTLFTASFSETDYSVTVRCSNEGYGTVEGGGVYSYGSVVTIAVHPNRHYTFKHWNDGNTENPRVVIVERDAMYVATLVPDTLQIYVVPNDSHYGTASGTGRYVYGSSVTCTATPAEGYHFVRWGNGATDNPYTLRASDNITHSHLRHRPRRHRRSLGDASHGVCHRRHHSGARSRQEHGAHLRRLGTPCGHPDGQHRRRLPLHC